LSGLPAECHLPDTQSPQRDVRLLQSLGPSRADQDFRQRDRADPQLVLRAVDEQLPSLGV
jgi:hypothetical protein